MSETVIQSKITAPRLNSKIVRRERLTALLNENISKSLIIVCAPAGFGKTTLVLDYLTSYNSKHTWFSIPHKGIEDASTFFEYLISSVNNINEEFGKSTLEVLKQFATSPKMSKELVYACTASFINEFQKCFKEDVLLIIDDLHFIDSEKSKAVFKEFFSELLENIPANLHLVIVSRVKPGINLTALKAKRNVFIIDEKALNFTKEETELLLKDIYKVSYDDKDIKVLDKNIKGWITGLHLLLQAYGEDFSIIKYQVDISYSNIFDFFADEIFDNLNPELQEFLMVTSLMENFDDKLANSVLGITNSKELTEELIHKNLFIHQINTIDKEKKNINYGYHALFREFLNRKIKNSKIEEEIKKLMEKIGDYYLSISDEMSAVNYYIDAENTKKSIPIITKLFFSLYDLGKYDVLQKWIAFIPEHILNDSAPLMYRLGYYNFYLSSDDKKTSYFIDRALRLFDFQKNEGSYINCNNIKVGLFMKKGKLLEAVKNLELLLKHDLKIENRIHILCDLSGLYSLIGEYKKAIKILDDSVKICESKNLNKLVNLIYLKYGRLFLILGNYGKSIHYLQKSSERVDMMFDVISNTGNIAYAYGCLCDYNTSFEYFKSAFVLLKKYNLPYLWMVTSGQKAQILFNIGEITKSTKILEEVFEFEIKYNDRKYLFEIACCLLYNYCYCHDYNNSNKYIKICRKYSKEIDAEYFKKQFYTWEAFFIQIFNNKNCSEEKLLDLYDYFNSINDRIYKLIILKLLSIYYLQTNNEKFTEKFLAKYLNEFKFYAIDLYKFRELIDFALSSPELAQYKDKIHCAFTEFFDRLNIEGTTEEYKQKMRIQIENLYDLKMNVFGGLGFISRGKIIPESKWKRKKSKSILSYMMLNPKEKYSREQLTDLFVSDSKSKDIDDSFRHKISAINNAVKLPYLSILQHEGKLLFLNPDCYFKSDVSEFDKYYKSAHSDSISKEEKIKACKKAIELYKGEFMMDIYEKWCEDLRDTYRNKYISISELLLDLLYEIKDIKNLIHYSEKLLSYDKLNEHAYLKLVEAHVESGKIRTAKETYSKMLKIFEEELAEKPDYKIISRINKLIN